MLQYQMLLQKILNHGEKRMDRTGVGTVAIFGETLMFDLQDGFPVTTTKKFFMKSMVAELAGFLEGTRSATRMRQLGTKIWDANANAEHWQKNPHCAGIDDMGPVYGSQWRDYNGEGIDQLADVVERIQTNPTDRRLLVTAWNPAKTRYMCLPPCHIFFQFFVRKDEFLDCQWYIRSVDSFLGMPFDIASYALLTHIVANQTGLKPGRVTMNSGDTHIYLNHMDQVYTQLQRIPKQLPKLKLDPKASINNFTPDMVDLIGYECDPEIKAEMAV